MADEQQDDAQKTEEPTQKRIEESRKKGQVANSKEVNNWLMLLAGTIIIGSISGSFMGELASHMRAYIEKTNLLTENSGNIHKLLEISFYEVLGFLSLPFVILLLAAFIGPFLQVGPLFAPEAIKPSLSKISIIKGFSRLFSLRSIVEFLKGIAKIAVISIVGYILIKPYFGQVDHMVGLPIALMLDELLALVMKLLIGVVVVMMIIAGLDLAYQRFEHTKQMRMTKQEVKDEYKQTEGDPHIKSKLKQLRSERARQRMMQAVPSADVVITNPTHYSIALKYDPEETEAPLCVAKGVDDMALRIREIAKENDIEIVENKPLARAMYDLVDIDELIPMEYYKAVAEIISFVFRKKGKLPS